MSRRMWTIVIAFTAFTGGADARDIRVWLTTDAGRVVADDMSSRRRTIALTHPDQRRTALRARPISTSGHRSRTWRIDWAPSFDVDPAAPAALAHQLRIVHARRPAPPAWHQRWSTLSTATALDGRGVTLTFTHAISDPRWRFDLDAAAEPIRSVPLWPVRTPELDVSVVPDIADRALPPNAVRISEVTPSGNASVATVWVWLAVDGGDDDAVAALRAKLDRRTFTPLFPRERVVPGVNRLDAAPPPVPDNSAETPPIGAVSVARRAHPWRGPAAAASAPHPLSVIASLAADRVTARLSADGISDSPHAPITVTVYEMVQYDGDAFPLGHPESTPTPRAWPIFGLKFYVEMGDDIFGDVAAPDTWELRGRGLRREQ